MLLIVFWQSSIIWLEVNEQPGLVHGTTTELLFIKLHVKIINRAGNTRSKLSCKPIIRHTILIVQYNCRPLV